MVVLPGTRLVGDNLRFLVPEAHTLTKIVLEEAVSKPWPVGQLAVPDGM